MTKTKAQLHVDTEIIEKLVDAVNKLNSNFTPNNKSTVELNDNDIMVEDGKGSGKFIKMNKGTYFQEMYTDVIKLKVDSTNLIENYQSEMKPFVKKIDDTLTKISDRFEILEKDVVDLKKSKPKRFGEWINEKGENASNLWSISKFIFMGIVIIYMLSTALPGIFKFLVQFLSTV